MGFQATICPDGNTAIAALEKQPFDCLLVDLDMPGGPRRNRSHRGCQKTAPVDRSRDHDRQSGRRHGVGRL